MSVQEYQALNLEEFLDDKIYENFDLVVTTDFYPLDFLFNLNELLRKTKTAMISTACAGLLGFVLTDFGENHIIFDKNGEPKKHVLISNIQPGGMITTEENKRHDLEDGDLVIIDEVIGIENINQKVYEVKEIISPFCFRVDE